MAYTRDPIPRSDLTPEQRRRLGALQGSKAVLYGSPGYHERPVVDVDDLLRVARFITTGEPDA